MSAGGWELYRGGEGYPEVLEDLEGPPETIYGIGDAGALLGPCISVVGTRRPTPYGMAVAQMVGRVAAHCGMVVVSGGARGCDYAAGRAALDAGGRTVVVSGCGADRIYPASSRDLFEDASRGRSCVISIERWGMAPLRYTFPKRNRIIAALSKSLVVTEAGLPSGTFSTASCAAELGREVYAVPGSIFSPNSAGANRLIESGAAIIADEVALETRITMDYGLMVLGVEHDQRKDPPIMAALVASPARPEELALQMGEEVLTIIKNLANYESAGLVRRLPDGRYAPTERAFLANEKEGSQCLR